MGISWLLKPVALVSTVALSTLGVLSRRYQRARFYFNLTIYVSTVGLMSVWGVVVSILATAAGQVRASFAPCVDRRWQERAIIYLTNGDIEIKHQLLCG